MLSVIIPVYNEFTLVTAVIERVLAVPLEKEIIVVDDGSTDGTRQLLEKNNSIKLYCHDRNRGKGAAVRTALEYVSGDIVLIQDADLEYDPTDYDQLILPILCGYDVVYGSRFKGERVQEFRHYLINKVLTVFSNVCTNLNLSDMETGYKVFRRDVISSVRIESNRFGFEPEITAKVKKYRICEVPISYNRRTVGKKLKWHDGITALWSIVWFNLKSV